MRRVIHRAAEFVPKPLLCLAWCSRGATLHGLYVGPHREAWSAAADLSAQLNIIARAPALSPRAVDAAADLR